MTKVLMEPKDVGAETVDHDSKLKTEKHNVQSQPVSHASSNIHADLMMMHNDMVRYYSNFGMMDTSTADGLFHSVFEPSVL